MWSIYQYLIPKVIPDPREWGGVINQRQINDVNP